MLFVLGCVLFILFKLVVKKILFFGDLFFLSILWNVFIIVIVVL